MGGTKIKTLKTKGVNGEVKIHTVGVNGVTEIQDNSIDAEQNYVAQYLIHVDKKLKYSYMNCQFEIEYK